MLPTFFSRYAICIECSESIFNPICPVCIANEIEAWLKAENLAEKAKVIFRDAMNKILTANSKLEGESSRCIICKEKDDYMCPYCFTEKIYDFLKEKNVSAEVIRKFIEIFNFDFDRTGYSKEIDEGSKNEQRQP
jgi:hypothetical protein